MMGGYEEFNAGHVRSSDPLAMTVLPLDGRMVHWACQDQDLRTPYSVPF